MISWTQPEFVCWRAMGASEAQQLGALAVEQVGADSAGKLPVESESLRHDPHTVGYPC